MSFQIHPPARRLFIDLQHRPGIGAPVEAPGDTGIVRERAQRIQDGERTLSTPKRNKLTGFSFRFDALESDEVFRVAVQERLLRVTFNDRLELVRELKTQKHQDAIKAMAHAAIAVYSSTHQGQQILLRELAEQDTVEALQRVWHAWNGQRSTVLESVA